MARVKKPKIVKPKDEPKLEPVKEPEPVKLAPQDEPKLEMPTEASVPVAPVDPDYLRQYQYRSINNQPTVGGLSTDPDPGSRAESMKRSLLSQEKVSIFIPRAENEDPKIRLSVTLNGYRLDLPKNTYIQVPFNIAEVIRESLNQQASALLPFQINRNKATETALS